MQKGKYFTYDPTEIDSFHDLISLTPYYYTFFTYNIKI